MKKIFALIAAAVVAASMISCEIADPYIRPLGSEEWKDYAGKLLSNSALLPVEMVDMVQDMPLVKVVMVETVKTVVL